MMKTYKMIRMAWLIFFVLSAWANAQASEGFSIDIQSGYGAFARQQQIQLAAIQSEIATNKGVFSLHGDDYTRTTFSLMDKNSIWPDRPWLATKAKHRDRLLDICQYVKSDGLGRLVLMLEVQNVSDEPLVLSRLIPLRAVRIGDRKNGSVFHYSDLHKGLSSLQDQQTYKSHTLIAANRPALTAGFLTSHNYTNGLSLTPTDNGLELTAILQADGVILPAGAARRADLLWVSCLSQVNREMELFAQTAAQINNVQSHFENFAAWCSWYSGSTFSQNLGGRLEALVRANIPVIAEKFLPYGLTCMRVVDDSLQRGLGDWPLVTDALPSGYPALAQEMRQYGILPGFWFDAHRVGIDSKIFDSHPEWLAQEKDAPIQMNDLNYGKYALLDATVPEARKRLTALARQFQMVGYGYCFADFIGQVAVSPKNSHNPQSTCAQTARLAIEAMRKGFGENFYFLSQNMPFANWGLIDAMRVSLDSFGDKIVTYRDALAWWYLNQRLFFIDPDAWCPLRHDLLWDRCWGSWQVLAGFPITIGADFRQLDEKREEMIKKILPPLKQPGRPRDNWEREYPVVVEQTASIPDETWKILGLFNFRPYAVKVNLNLDRIWHQTDGFEDGFESSPDRVGKTDRSYLIYDFWQDRFLGIYQGSGAFEIDAEKGHRVLAMREYQRRPQLLSVGDHIGQGLEELKRLRWHPRKKMLSGKTLGLRGVRDTVVRLYVPDGWSLKEITRNGQAIPSQKISPNICQFTAPDRDYPVEWKCTFDVLSQQTPQSTPRPINHARIAELSPDKNSVKSFKANLPDVFRKLLGNRYLECVPEFWTLQWYARPLMVGGEKYDPAVGFGVARGQILPHWPIHRFLVSPFAFYDPTRFAYQITDLDPRQKYRIGVTVFSPNSQPHSIRLSARRLSDQKKTVLDDEIVCDFPSEKNNVRQVHWRDLPSEAIDPAGILIELEKLAGSGVYVSEIWMLSKN